MGEYLLNNDQPTTCPKCGARTEFSNDFEAGVGWIQHHQCLNCDHRFTTCDEDEDDSDEEE